MSAFSINILHFIFFFLSLISFYIIFSNEWDIIVIFLTQFPGYCFNVHSYMINSDMFFSHLEKYSSMCRMR